MLVAVIHRNSVSINEYPELQNIDEIRNDFLPDTTLIELFERPENRDGYDLKHNGVEFYYEKLEDQTAEPSQLDRIESALNLLTGDSVSTSAVTEAITEGVNDV